jgi:hypothetical protein
MASSSWMKHHQAHPDAETIDVQGEQEKRNYDIYN